MTSAGNVCDSCGKRGVTLSWGFWGVCKECERREREREEDAEREKEREEQAASDHSEMLSEIERSREESSENIAAAAAYIANAKNNPGDYDCPACRYTTLKYLASRCPKCQADTPSGYWLPIIERERARAEADRKAKEEWERGRPAREVEARATAIIERRTGRWSSFWTFYYAYLLPILLFVSLPYFVSGKIPTLNWDAFLIAIPGLNWLLILMVMLVNDSQRLMVFYGLIGWAILGGILWFVTKPNTKIQAVSTAEAEAWESGRKERERKARNKAFVSDVFSSAFGFGWGGAILGAFVGFGKGCVRFDVSRPNPYGHPTLLEPFWYIPETALYVFIIGAIIGIIVRVIKGQK